MKWEELEMPEPCDADWEAMPPSTDGRSRFCGRCERDLIDLTRLREHEAIDLFQRVALGADEPCINAVRRGDGNIVFADTPDVPASALVRKFARSAAILALAAACSPSPRSSDRPDDFEDDHVDGEILSPAGANHVARGRARPARLFRSREMDRRTAHERHQDTHEPGPANLLMEDIVHVLENRIPDFERQKHVSGYDQGNGFSIRFERDVSYLPPTDCPPKAKCSVQRRFDSARGVTVSIECFTGPWTGAAVVQPVELGELRLVIRVDAAKPGQSAGLRQVIDEVVARHRRKARGP